jgi:hypothetical protein
MEASFCNKDGLKVLVNKSCTDKSRHAKKYSSTQLGQQKEGTQNTRSGQEPESKHAEK